VTRSHHSQEDFLTTYFYYQLEHIFVLDRTLFTQALTTTPHLSLGGFFEMVYEHLLGCFIPEDPSLGFWELFQAIVVVSHGDIFKSMALMLRVNRLLAMAKDIGGLHPIAIGEVFFQLINHSIVLSL
jgi:hypothetical protein